MKTLEAIQINEFLINLNGEQYGTIEHYFERKYPPLPRIGYGGEQSFWLPP